MAVVHETDAASFRASGLPAGRVAVLFDADWCGFSRRFRPHFKRLWDAWIVDASDDGTWDAHGLRVVPTVVLFEDGREVRRWEGALNAVHMEQVVAAFGAEPVSSS